MTLTADYLISLIDNEQPKTKAALFNWDRYRPLEEIWQWMDQMIEDHSDVVSGFVLGYSTELRPIRGVKISHGRVTFCHLPKKFSKD